MNSCIYPYQKSESYSRDIISRIARISTSRDNVGISLRQPQSITSGDRLIFSHSLR